MFLKRVPATPAGKAFALAGGALMSLALIAQLIAVGEPWWTDTHHRGEGSDLVLGELEVTLWNVHVTSPQGKFEDYSIGWEEYCGEKYANEQSWCHKMRTVRATTFLAIIFGMLALVSYTLTAFVNRGWGGRALLCTIVSMSCAICAFSVSIFFPTYSRPSVNTPGLGFVMMCFGAATSFITSILSFYGMRYNFTSSLKETSRSATAQDASNGQNQDSVSVGVDPSATLGKACVIAAGSLILLGVVMELVGIVGPWWIDTHVHFKNSNTYVADVVATLWSVELTSPQGLFDHLSLSWEEYCGEGYVNEQSWCHKIRAVRTTLILAILLGVSSLISLGMTSVVKKRGLGTAGVICAFFSLICAVCAFSTSLFYPTSSSPSVDTPGFAFIVVCLAALLTVMAVLLACYGLWYSSNSGFKNHELTERNWKLSGDTTPPVKYGSESELMPEGGEGAVAAAGDIALYGMYVSEKV